MNVLAESRLASSSIGKRFIISSRKTATQLGSRPTTGVLDSISGRNTSRISRSSSLALSSIPKSYKGRPQQSDFGGITTWNPAASITSTAACAVCGWKWLLNVSGQSTTRGIPTFRGSRLRNHETNVSGANDGVVRRVEIPPSAWKTLPTTGACVIRFTTPGASEASRAHQYTRPIA